MNGIIIINKPKGITSRDVVDELVRKFEYKKIGHAGTLDPIATGVLIVGIGDGTKLLSDLTNDDKEYIAEFKLGIQTDTLDITGKIANQSNKVTTLKEIEQVIRKWPRVYEQEVPKYSAVKISGKRAYELARDNNSFEMPKRVVNIYELELLECKDDVVQIRTLVSKGTYIRSLINDIGIKLGTYATMTNLIRTSQGKFKLSDAKELEQISETDMIPLEEIITDKTEINIELFNKIKYGQILDNVYNKDKIYFIYQNKLVAIYEPYQKDITKIKPVHVFVKNID